MKKALPFILATILGVAIIALVLTGINSRERKPDFRISLSETDRIPYGAYAAYFGLEKLFPEARLFKSDQEPGYWDSVSNYDTGQIYFVLARHFNADDMELRQILEFVENGNDVFICAQSFSTEAESKFKLNITKSNFDFFSDNQLRDSLSITLTPHPFGKASVYRYPGKSLGSTITQANTDLATPIGYDKSGLLNAVHLRYGKGNVFIHSEPMAFSNYFLLHKKNFSYFERLLSVFKPGAKKIIWDTYYRKKRQYEQPEKGKNWFSVFMSYRSLRAALWTALLALIAYVLFEMRRKQRQIPVITKHRNDSLEFVKTIGRLYFDKSDHLNLARKMSTYFLEFVRNKYKLPTGTLDDDFIQTLQNKSGASEESLKNIVSFIKHTESVSAISASQMTNFYHWLELFYRDAR